jgi:hypothetical protein
MKIGGVELNGPNEDVLVLPRLNGQDIVFKARAIVDMEEFDTLCKSPEPPGIRTAKDGFQKDYTDGNYLSQMGNYRERRVAYMVIKTLEPSEIEWETVNIEESSTWPNWKKDLQKGGLSDAEIGQVVNCVAAANSLDEAKLKEARESFLRGQGIL